MSTPKGNARPAALVACALGIWMGVHAFRTFAAMVVWNTAEDLPTWQMGAVAAAIFALGLIAWLPLRYLGGTRPAWRFGLALALFMVLRQALPGEYTSPLFSYATMIVWLWWLPAFLAESEINLAPAVLLGLIFQAAGQAALHGLDLPVLRGSDSVLAAAGLGLTFVAALWRARPSQPGGRAPWGALALGPYLFLQMTLLANVGHVSMHSNWGQPVSSLVILLGLLGGLAALRYSPSWMQRMGIGVGATAILVWGESVWPVVPAQVGLALLLAATLEPTGRPARGLTYFNTAISMAGLMAMLFLFYSRFGWPILWPFAALAMAFAAMLSPQMLEQRRLWPLFAGGAASVIGLVSAVWPYSLERPLLRAAPEQLTIFQYNIHQGYDVFSAPSPEAIAEVIARSDADLIGLEEVNRGWDISGGVDMVAWLRWRFPQYYVVYGPMNGSLWGNVIMSRYPVRDTGARHYTPGQNDVPRGLVWATIPAAGGDLLFITTHFTAYEGFDQDRSSQADELLKFWQGRRLTVIAGDFNAHPGDEAIRKLLGAGLVDVPGSKGLGAANTYTSLHPYERIDYIFSSPDLITVEAAVPETLASDHSPVAATVRMADR